MTDEILEELEKKAEEMDAGIHELGLVKKADYEEMQDEIESLEDEKESLEDELEELEDEIDEVKSAYAETLAESTGFDEEKLTEKFEVAELREMYEERLEDGEVDEIGSPAPNSGDVDPGEEEEATREEERQEEILAELSEQMSNTDMAKYPREVEINDLDDLRDIIETYEKRGSPWDAAAEPYRETLEELTG